RRDNPFRAGGNIPFNDPSGIGANRGLQAGALAIRGEIDEVQYLLRPDFYPAPPGRLRVVPDADFGAALGRLNLRGADLKLWVSRPTGDIARIFRIRQQCPCLEIQPINIGQLTAPEVQRDQHFVRKIRVGRRDLGAPTLKGGVIADIARDQIDGVRMPVFVAVDVLQVDYRASV